MSYVERMYVRREKKGEERKREEETRSGKAKERLRRGAGDEVTQNEAAVLSAPIDYGAGKSRGASRAKTLWEKNYPVDPIRHPRGPSSACVSVSS